MPQPPTPRDHAPINFWHPHIGDTPITTSDHLHHILNTEYPGLQRNPHYLTWLHDAETHLKLIQYLKDQTHLQRGDRKRFAKELSITRQKFTAWAQEGRKPRLYYELDRMLSKTKAHTKINELHTKNNGIQSSDDVVARFRTYYLMPLHEQSKQHTKRLIQCNQYFQALDLLKEGGAYLDVAHTIGVHHSDIKRWLEGSRPDYVELTSHVPADQPNPGYKWLPLKLDRAFVPATFIQAPQIVTHHKHIIPVLDQLRPLNNKTMEHWRTYFGPISKTDAFYYILGLIASDFQKSKPRISSTELVLTLSKNYTWSKTLGDAACYYLGQLGIHAKKVKDRDSSAGPNACHSWRSQKTPLCTWIMYTCFGLQPDQTTTYDPLYARWLLTAPHRNQVAILQGFADGDGWASIRDQCIGIYAGPNILLIKDLLKTFQIQSSDDGQRVRIYSHEGIKKAAELPLFRFATTRLETASKVSEMIIARQNQDTASTFPNILEEMQNLRDQGYSYGSIAAHIFEKHGISYDHKAIIRRLKKFKRSLDNDV